MLGETQRYTRADRIFAKGIMNLFWDVMKSDSREFSRKDVIAYDPERGFMPSGKVEYSDSQIKAAVSHVAKAFARKGICPWPNQIAAAYLSLIGNNVLQIPTGNGKTYIAYLMASATRLLGDDYGVRIITTNSYLAKRDAKDTAKFAEEIGLKNAVVTFEDGVYRTYVVEGGELREVSPSDLIEIRDGKVIVKADVIYTDQHTISFRRFIPVTEFAIGNGESVKHSIGSDRIALMAMMYSDRFMHILDESDEILIDSGSSPSVIETSMSKEEYNKKLEEALAAIASEVSDELKMIYDATESGNVTRVTEKRFDKLAAEGGFDGVVTDGTRFMTNKIIHERGSTVPTPHAMREIGKKIHEALYGNSPDEEEAETIAYAWMEDIAGMYDLVQAGIENRIRIIDGGSDYEVLSKEGRPMKGTKYTIHPEAVNAAILATLGKRIDGRARDSVMLSPRVWSTLSPLGNVLISGTNAANAAVLYFRTMGYPRPIEIPGYAEMMLELKRGREGVGEALEMVGGKIGKKVASVLRRARPDRTDVLDIGERSTEIKWYRIREEWKKAYGLEPTEAYVSEKARTGGVIVNERFGDSVRQIIRESHDAIRQGRPVLISMHDVDSARALRNEMEKEGMNVVLLTADNIEEEDRIYEEFAPVPGNVTIAVRVAGRGVDIKLPKSVVERGGMHLIIHGMPHERAWIQEFGRVGRKGEPGTVTWIVDAETAETPADAEKIMEAMGGNEDVLWRRMSVKDENIKDESVTSQLLDYALMPIYQRIDEELARTSVEIDMTIEGQRHTEEKAELLVDLLARKKALLDVREAISNALSDLHGIWESQRHFLIPPHLNIAEALMESSKGRAAAIMSAYLLPLITGASSYVSSILGLRTDPRAQAALRNLAYGAVYSGRPPDQAAASGDTRHLLWIIQEVAANYLEEFHGDLLGGHAKEMARKVREFNQKRRMMPLTAGKEKMPADVMVDEIMGRADELHRKYRGDYGELVRNAISLSENAANNVLVLLNYLIPRTDHKTALECARASYDAINMAPEAFSEFMRGVAGLSSAVDASELPGAIRKMAERVGRAVEEMMETMKSVDEGQKPGKDEATPGTIYLVREWYPLKGQGMRAIQLG